MCVMAGEGVVGYIFIRFLYEVLLLGKRSKHLEHFYKIPFQTVPLGGFLHMPPYVYVVKHPRKLLL